MITKGVAQGLNKTIGRRYFSNFTPAKLPDLAYDYSELEPAISGKIMELHHKKHHQAYVNGYNQAVEQVLDAEAKGDVAKVVSLQSAIKFNGGGHVNHSIFWQNLAPKGKGGGELPDEKSVFAQAVKLQFGSFDNLKTQLTAKTLGVQGSGWGWLAYNKNTKSLVLQDMPNQDPVTMLGLTPLLGIDIWEHAFYLQYQNVKADYLKAIWDVVNWKDVEARYKDASK